jgi:hypothetical protein
MHRTHFFGRPRQRDARHDWGGSFWRSGAPFLSCMTEETERFLCRLRAVKESYAEHWIADRDLSR